MTRLGFRVGVDVGLEHERGGVRLQQQRLLVDTRRHVVLALAALSSGKIFVIFKKNKYKTHPAKVEGQGAVLLPDAVDCLHHVVAAVRLARLLSAIFSVEL